MPLFWNCRKNHPAWAVLKQYRYAHRGYHEKPTVPENSLAAFRRAVDRGWGAELDVHLMADGNLAVIHDSGLKRTAGADVNIEDLTLSDLERYVLEESQEKIPLLSQVLDVFEGKTPLIIELKTENGNADALCGAVAAMLDGYRGDYCIESFDPRVLMWFRKHRPDICRGQLAENFFRDKSSLPPMLKWVLSNLLTTNRTRPDFIAYRWDHRDNFPLRRCRKNGAVEVSWTVRDRETLTRLEGEGCVCIFETFDPEI